MTGGGIGRHISELSRLLAPEADVTVLTSAQHRERHAELDAAGDPALAPGVRFAWVPEPEGDVRPFASWFHAWSAACCEALRELARAHPIDLVEVEDYRGLGAVAIDARRAGLREFASTRFAVRLHTTWEMTAVVDHALVDPEAASWIAGLERAALHGADVLLAPSAATWQGYRRFYGELLDGRVPVEVPVAIESAGLLAGDPVAPPPVRAGVRLLCVGRLQEVKGVRALVRAMASLPGDVSLTFLGGDTMSAPGGGSMREHLERLAAGDTRISFLDHVEPAEVAAVIDAHHVVVLPSRFESFGYVAREALARNRPVVVTPVGGLVGVTGADDGGGWVSDDLSDEALVRALLAATEDRDALDARIAAGRPRAVLAESLDADAYAAAYQEVITSPGRTDALAAAVAPTSVTVVVMAFGSRDLELTLKTLRGQADPPELEIVLVCDAIDHIPAAVAAGVHDVEPYSDGVAAYGALLDRRDGDGPVLFLDAGVALHPEFLTRALAGLRGPAAPAYITAYGEGRGMRNRPVNNVATSMLGTPGLGGGAVLVRPDLLAPPYPRALSAGRAVDAVLTDLAARREVGAVLPQTLVGRSVPLPPGPTTEHRPLAFLGDSLLYG